MLSLVLSLALALAPHAHAQQQRASGHLPTVGVLVPGVSLAGVKIGQTQAQVKRVLGANYSVCTTANSEELCKEPIWLFEYTRGEPLGVGAKFHNGKVTAIFTLGMIDGWKTKDGLKMGDPVSNIYNLYQTPIYTKCIGFEAFSMRKGTTVTSIYTASGVVYGFAITARGEPICQ